MGAIKLSYVLTIRDTKTGKIIGKPRHIRSHSFDLQFLQMLETAITHIYNGASAGLSVKDTGNAARTLQFGLGITDAIDLALFAANTDNTYGIVVGTGSNATSPSDVALQTIIASGAGVGQLTYGNHSYTTSAIAGSNVNLVITRTFINTSGGTINVTELGMYLSQRDSGATQRYFCIVRDLVTAVPVPTAKTLTVTATFTTTN
jgi:hypothetical protein